MGFRLGKVIALAVFLFIVARPAMADLVFSVSPGPDRQEIEKIYQPLLKYMEKVLGDRIVFDYTSDWREYSINMRNERYDIVFDAPHFGSWRIKNINHTPVARLSGNLGHAIVRNTFNTSIRKLRDLVGVKICSAVSPSLSNMTVYNLFENPVHMPIITEINGDSSALYSALRAGACDAAIMSESDLEQLQAGERRNLKIVVRSDPVPERTITISKRLATKKTLLAQMLISREGAKAALALSRQEGKTRQTFVKVKPAEYNGLDAMLSQVVWGW